MQKREDIDIILRMLEKLLELIPGQQFVTSLHYQYLERGSLSRKQLEGLLSKASKQTDIPANWLATVEAIIKKMPVREKAPASNHAPLIEIDEQSLQQVTEVLAKLPHHKEAKLIQAKLQRGEPLNDNERKDLKRFYQVVQKLK